MSINVCFISLEYFGWGKYGGIGKATRDIASGLVNRGLGVSVVVPRGLGQSTYELVDGVDVYGFQLKEYPIISRLLHKIDADIFHSEDPTLGTWIAKKTQPNRIHLLTSQNPKSSEDWRKVIQYYPFRRKIYNTLIDPTVKKCIKEMDYVYCQAKYIIQKTKKLYNLNYNPFFLPNPVEVPTRLPQKSSEPRVLFLGRLDKEKNPEQFFHLAKEFPDINFVVAGCSHNKQYNKILQSKYSGMNNISMLGFVDGREKIKVLSSSWVLINTSISECLPVSFLEAAAHGCAILSPHDPDGFSSNFGVYTSLNRLCEGLSWLLKDENWRERGAMGYRYVKETHEVSKVIQAHINEYKKKLM